MWYFLSDYFKKRFFFSILYDAFVYFYHKCVEKNRGDGIMKELRREVKKVGR